MSVFTKRRKIVRQKQEENRKRQKENDEKLEKCFNDILKVCVILKNEHQEFETIDDDERAKLFVKIFNEIHGHTE